MNRIQFWSATWETIFRRVRLGFLISAALEENYRDERRLKTRLGRPFHHREFMVPFNSRELRYNQLDCRIATRNWPDVYQPTRPLFRALSRSAIETRFERRKGDCSTGGQFAFESLFPSFPPAVARKSRSF